VNAKEDLQMGRSNVFLSGWEYNRLLQKDVLAPMQSALPGRVLWEGAMPFWLFDKVFCTKESLDNEVLAYEKLGWATGRIFAELAEWEWLVPVNWEDWAKANPIPAGNLRDEHTNLVNQYGNRVRQLVDDGHLEELDKMKAKLLQPILDEHKCFLDISPNSLERWLSLGDAMSKSAVGDIGETIAEPLSTPNNTLTLCEKPGKGLPHHVFATQLAVEEEHEKSMIPRLFAGDLTKEEYYRKLANYSQVYQPINKKMEREWNTNKTHLKELRDHARETIWTKVHNEWLPRAEEEPSFIPELRALVGQAVNRAEFPFIDSFTDWGIRLVSLGVASAYFAADMGSPLIVAATTLVGEGLVREIGQQRSKSEELRLFYQRVRRSRRRGNQEAL
jgi:hypothetical protein